VPECLAAFYNTLLFSGATSVAGNCRQDATFGIKEKDL
jgi:hypothetical protein